MGNPYRHPLCVGQLRQDPRTPGRVVEVLALHHKLEGFALRVDRASVKDARDGQDKLLDAELKRMAGGDSLQAMQCHCTPDDDPQICVGFALQVGRASTGFRLAVHHGLVDPDVLETNEDLHTLQGVLAAHGGVPS